MNEIDSYIYGLLITDGSMYLTSRNRGKVTLEVNDRDVDIVNKLANVVPNSKIRERVRNTNFKSNYKTVIFSNHQLDFRSKLISEGFPLTEKTENASPPIIEYDEISFWRGVIDGDGSLGFISGGIPFISLVTKSERLKVEYLNFLKQNYGIVKKINRNKRDRVYNITVKNETGVKLSRDLYLNENTFGLFIDRKYNKAVDIQKWKRT